MARSRTRAVALSLVAGLSLTIGAAAPVMADSIALVNAGFETPDGPLNDVIGWDEVEFGGQGYRTGSFTVPVAPWGGYSVDNPEGDRIGYIDATSRISQNSNHALVLGEIYTLSAWLGNRLDNAQRPTDLEIYADNGSGGLGALLASASVGNEAAAANGEWGQLTVTFDTTDLLNAALVAANLGQNLHVSIAHSQDETGGGEVGVDGVQFSFQSVPEPASLALLGAGCLTMLRRRSQA